MTVPGLCWYRSLPEFPPHGFNNGGECLGAIEYPSLVVTTGTLMHYTFDGTKKCGAVKFFCRRLRHVEEMVGRFGQTAFLAGDGIDEFSLEPIAGRLPFVAAEDLHVGRPEGIPPGQGDDR